MLKLTTPVAVLLGTGFGGICVAAAVFVALRERPAPPVISELPAPLAPFEAPAIEKRAASVSDAPTATALDSAERALQAQHAKLSSTCWQPLAAKPPAMRSARYVIRLAFDKTGHQSSKAFLSSMGESRIDITECIARTISPIVIPPQDTPQTFEASLTLP